MTDKKRVRPGGAALFILTGHGACGFNGRSEIGIHWLFSVSSQSRKPKEVFTASLFECRQLNGRKARCFGILLSEKKILNSDAGSGQLFGFDLMPQEFKEDDPAMRRQSIRTIALILGVIIAAAAPARAGTITFADVVRTIGATGQFRAASEVRLAAQSGRAVSRQSDSPQSSVAPSSQPGQQVAAGSAQQEQTAPSGGSATQGPAAPDATLSQSGGQIQTVDLGDVTGTVCDCGEIPVTPIAKRAIPWWLLAGVPLVCVSGICTGDDTPPETPTPPTPPNTPTPEPMTLLLFGSGLLALGAGARRRHGRKQLLEVTTVATTEEV